MHCCCTGSFSPLNSLRDNGDFIVDGEYRGKFLFGDAIGRPPRDLCEGIGPAIESALLAAQSIVTGSDYSLAGISNGNLPAEACAATLGSGPLPDIGNIVPVVRVIMF